MTRSRATSRSCAREVVARVALLVAPGIGCRPVPQDGSHAGFAPGDAALVGQVHVKLETVDRIAASRSLSRREAADIAVRDALLGSLGEARAGSRIAGGVRRAAAARAMVEELSRLSREAGPVTDGELDAGIAARWWELDRPRMIQTCHAVVLTKKPEDDAAAQAVARSILDQVKGVTDPDEFKRRARAVPASGAEVRVEDLDPVAADGRALDPDVPHPPDYRGSSYDPEFVRAVFAIDGAVSRTSPVVRTPFGYHVILLVKELPELRVPREEARARLAGEIIDHRAKASLEKLRAELRQATPVEIDRAALELMARVEVVP